jgi:MSHA biogenesis protein MshP
MFCKCTQRGFSLPVAIFIIVIMALIGAAMVSIMQTSQQSVSTAVLSTRAFFAAESGAQQALGNLFPLNGSAPSCLAPYPTINYSTSGLAGCTAVVTCSGNIIGSKTYYTLNSTGTCDISGSRAVRQLEVRAATP